MPTQQAPKVRIDGDRIVFRSDANSTFSRKVTDADKETYPELFKTKRGRPKVSKKVAPNDAQGLTESSTE